MKYVIVPEFLWVFFFYGGIIVAFVSLLMGVRGIIQKRERRYFFKWCVILAISIIAIALTITGVFTANTMLGG